MSRPVCSDPANALLLWHVSGKLEGAEAASVREHLTLCLICAREVEILDRLTAAMLEHPDVLAPGSQPRPAAPRAAAGEARAAGGRAAAWCGWALAAALVVPGMLGIYWLSLGSPTVRREEKPGTSERPGPSGGGTPPGTGQQPLRPALLLDLGGGPRRDAASGPTLTVTPQAESIVITFRIPPRSDGRFSVAVEGRDGSEVTSQADLSAPDEVGRHAYILAADLLHPGVDYDLVLRLHEAAGGVTIYRYPFRVLPVRPAEPAG